MRKVIGIGETVLDIIFRGNEPIGAVPGGSTYNSIISLGRAGIESTFISETGDDRVGRRIIDFLKENGVDPSSVSMFQGKKSPVSLAFLNEQNDAEYLFYKDHDNDRLDFVFPEIHADDIVVFGSYYAVNPVIRQQVGSLLEAAHQADAIVYYDVNFRSVHRNEVVKLTPNLLENFEYADIIRGSVEDFDNLFQQTDPERIYKSQISFYCQNFICTNGSNPIHLMSRSFRKQYPVPQLQTVSTIGAGDNFNAGFMFGLIRLGITRSDLAAGLSETQWDRLMACAQAFSANVCQSLSNYVDKDFGEKMKNATL